MQEKVSEKIEKKFVNENATLERLTTECKTPEKFEKYYNSIKKPGYIKGLGEITFGLNPEFYFNLDKFITKAQDKLTEAEQIHSKLEGQGKFFEISSKYLENAKSDLETWKVYKSKLYAKKVEDILADNIKVFSTAIKGFPSKKKKFLKALVNVDGQENIRSILGKDKKSASISFGVANHKGIEDYAAAFYSQSRNTVYIDADPEIRRIKNPNISDERLMEDLSHEFIHCYDRQVLQFPQKLLNDYYYEIQGNRAFCGLNFLTFADF